MKVWPFAFDPLLSPNNQEIGNLFGIGYSSIGRRVTIMKSKMSGEDEMNKRLEKYKSLIKVRPYDLRPYVQTAHL